MPSLGVDFDGQTIVIVDGEGKRTVMNGQFLASYDWLDVLRMSVGNVPARDIALALALPVNLLKGPENYAKAARDYKFQSVITCSSSYAMAVALPVIGPLVVIRLSPNGNSVSCVSRGLPSSDEEDFVRPIAGREARELVVSVRCLLKDRRREERRRFLRRVIIGGDPAELRRLGQRSLEQEFRALGVVPEFQADRYIAATGAMELALNFGGG